MPWRRTELMLMSRQPRKRPHRNSDLDLCGRPTGLQGAAAEGKTDKVKRLLDLRADINAADEDGNTALHLAAVSGHEAVALVLLEWSDDLSVDALSPDGLTALCLAAKQGHNSLVLQLLRAKADVRGYSRTALHFAAESRHYSVLMTLLGEGEAEINYCTADMQPVLVSVAEHGDYDVVLWLLQQAADVNAPGRRGRTALHVAAEDGRGEVVSQLLERNANVNASTEDGKTTLSLIASAGHSDVVLELLEKWKADIHAARDGGRIALYLAAKEGQACLAERLLKQQANVDACGEDGATALHCAVEHGQKDVVVVLTQRKAEWNIRRNDGRTALHIAVAGGHASLVSEALHQPGVDVNGSDASGRNALCLAAAHAHSQILKHLLLFKANTAYKNREDREMMALHYAAESGCKEAVVSLLDEEGAAKRLVDAAADMHQTALCFAARANHLKVVETLLDKKAAINAGADHRHSALILAAQEEHWQLVSSLLRARADIHSKTTHGETCLHLAAAASNGETVQKLMDLQADVALEDIYGRTALDRVGEDFLKVFGRTKVSFERLVSAEGPQALMLLEDWAQDAFLQGKIPMRRANLAERLRVILAPHAPDVPGPDLVVEQAHVDLSSQNLLLAPKVHACLKCLPGLRANDVCDPDFLRCLAQATNSAIFQVDAVQAVVAAAWEQSRMATALEVASDVLTVPLLVFISFSLQTSQSRHGWSAWAFAAAVWVLWLHAKRSLEELVQFLWFLRDACVDACQSQSEGRSSAYNIHRCSCCCLVVDVVYGLLGYVDFDNIADAVYLLVGWFAIVQRLLIGDEVAKPLMSAFCALAWLRALYSLRGEAWLGPRLLPILAAVKDTATFFLVAAVCILAATHAYYNLEILEINTNASEGYSMYVAFMQVVRLTLFVDFSLYDQGKFEGLASMQNGTTTATPALLQTEDYFWVHVLFHVVGVGITVLLMNLLIGVLGQNFEFYQDQNQKLFQRARAKMLWELSCRPWAQAREQELSSGSFRSMLASGVDSRSTLIACVSLVSIPEVARFGSIPTVLQSNTASARRVALWNGPC